MTLDGPRYFRLAVRLPAYSGVLAARLEQEQESPQAPVSAPAAAPRSTGEAPAVRVRPDRAGEPVKVVPLSAFGAMFPGAVEREKVPRVVQDR